MAGITSITKIKLYAFQLTATMMRSPNIPPVIIR